MSPDKAQVRTIVNQDGAAILDTERGTISTLNATGAYIWQALERGESEQEIVDGLAHKTGASPHDIRSDVSNFIAALQEQKMPMR